MKPFKAIPQSFMLVLLLLLAITPVLASVDFIEYPAPNEIIYQSSRIKLNVSTTLGQDCYFNYNNVRNQTINCDGISLVDLPSGNGVYNITVGDNETSITQSVIVRRPSGDMVIFTYIFTFLIVATLLFYVIVLLAKLASFSIGIYDLAANYALYFGLLFCYQLALEYVPIPLFLDWVQFFMTNLAWTAIVLPGVGYLICFFIRLFSKKGMDVQDYNGKVM